VKNRDPQKIKWGAQHTGGVSPGIARKPTGGENPYIKKGGRVSILAPPTLIKTGGGTIGTICRRGPPPSWQKDRGEKPCEPASKKPS